MIASTIVSILSFLAVSPLADASPLEKRWPAPQVDLGYASYRGAYNETTGISSFKGIRYAAAPTGDLRWKAPQPPVQLQGVLDATSFGPTCIQGTVGSSFANVTAATAAAQAALSTASEDCLLLNVFMPPGADYPRAEKRDNRKSNKKDSLPVLVWIHGGGYTLGSSNQFNADNLFSRPESDFILVTINYRLSVFGFLAGSEVKAGGALNAGLLDAEKALKWIQDHIQKFGGDPDRVTIFGESAGAGVVLHQVIARGGKTDSPLFQAAMVNSPFEPPEFYYNDTVPQGIYNSLAEAVNCSSVQDTLSCLRDVDAGTLGIAGTLIINTEEPGDFLTVPVIDGTFVTDRPEKLLKEKKVNGKYLWSSRNFNEGVVVSGNSFVPRNIGNNVTLQKQYLERSKPQLAPDGLDQLSQAYSATTFGTVQTATEFLYSEGTFGCQDLWMARAFGEKAYRSYFVYPGINTHGGDLAFYFYNDRVPAYQQSANIYMDNIVSFVKTYKPLDKAWKPFSASQPNEYQFNVTATLAPNNEMIYSAAGYLSRCQLWEDLAPRIPL